MVTKDQKNKPIVTLMRPIMFDKGEVMIETNEVRLGVYMTP